MTQYISKKICAGSYEVSIKGDDRVVLVDKMVFWDGPGWIASAQWIHDVYTDPLQTKREAMKQAKKILEKWE